MDFPKAIALAKLLRVADPLSGAAVSRSTPPRYRYAPVLETTAAGHRRHRPALRKFAGGHFG
jgi:hypothetical protein